MPDHDVALGEMEGGRDNDKMNGENPVLSQEPVPEEEKECASPVSVIVIPGKRGRGGRKRVAIAEDRNTSETFSVQSGQSDSIKLSVISGLDSAGYSELDSKFESKLVPQLVKMLDHGCAWIEGSWIDLNPFRVTSAPKYEKYETVLFSSEKKTTHKHRADINKELSYVADESNRAVHGPLEEGQEQSKLTMSSTQGSGQEKQQVTSVHKETPAESSSIKTDEKAVSQTERKSEDEAVVESSQKKKEETHFENADVSEEEERSTDPSPTITASASSSSKMDGELQETHVPIETEIDSSSFDLDGAHVTSHMEEQPENDTEVLELTNASQIQVKSPGDREQPICLANSDPLVVLGEVDDSSLDDEEEVVHDEEQFPHGVDDEDYALLVDDYLFEDGDASMAVVLSSDAEDCAQQESQDDVINDGVERKGPTLVPEAKQADAHGRVFNETLRDMSDAKEDGADLLEVVSTSMTNARVQYTERPQREIVEHGDGIIRHSWTHSEDTRKSFGGLEEWSGRYLAADGHQRGSSDKEMHIMKENKSMGDPPDQALMEPQVRSNDHFRNAGARSPRDPSPCRRAQRDRTPRWLEPDGIRDEPSTKTKVIPDEPRANEHRVRDKLWANPYRKDPEEGDVVVIDLAGHESAGAWSSKSTRSPDVQTHTEKRNNARSNSLAESSEDKQRFFKVLEEERVAALEVADRLRSRAALLKRKRMIRDKRKKERGPIDL